MMEMIHAGNNLPDESAEGQVTVLRIVKVELPGHFIRLTAPKHRHLTA